MNEAIVKVCQSLGAAHLARLVGVTPQAINEWKSGKRPVPLDRCVDIERATGGVVTCEELRPDKADYWAYLRCAVGSKEAA